MVVAQCLNGIFDIYSEEDMDDVFAEKNLMFILE
jgi:hypothetical protein